MRTLLRPRARMLLKGDEGGLVAPWVILGGGWMNLSVTGNGGTPAKGDPGGGGPPTPPPTPLIYWGDLGVTGNGDLPLATSAG
jgi:hypothetical protein